jgi:dihydropteroate synthase
LLTRAALDAGASILNDITGLADERMRSLAAERKIPTVIMHMKGTPKSMQANPEYEDVVSEIMAFFRERIALAVEAGLPEEYIILDPGIGFGKTANTIGDHPQLGDFRSLGLPILIGTSRKALWRALGRSPDRARLRTRLPSRSASPNGATSSTSTTW